VGKLLGLIGGYVEKKILERIGKKKVEKTQGKKERVHPLLQGPEHGWPSNPLKRGRSRNWVNEW